MNAFIKSAVVAAVVALAAPAFATTTITMTPNAAGTGSSGSFGGTHTTGTTFTDEFVFSVGATTGTVGASAIELTIDDSYLDLTTLTLNGKTISFDKVGNTYFAQTTASAITDPQTLSIVGSVVNGGGSYGGQVTFTTAAVPEAATWGMMLVGFGAMGAALRSNRRRAGAFA